MSDARVTLSLYENGKQVGAGVSDADGWFTFPLIGYRGEQPILAVDAEGFHPCQQPIFTSTLGDCRVRLDRRIDAAFFSDLRTAADPAERAARVDEILAADDWERMLASAFPYVGELHQDLLDAGARPPAYPDDRRADNALTLLAFWNDPCDRERLAPWALANPIYQLSPEPVQSPRLEDFCQAWATVHFAHEHVKGEWPPYFCRGPVVDAGRTHALLLFEVRYTHWRYNLYLVAARDGEGQPWVLRLVMRNLIT